MQNYLILYVDVEFIVGVVGTGYGNPHIIKCGNDILQWLYFFNDPHQHTVTFGKRYKKHYMDGEVNYYGRFLGSIESDDVTFSLRHVDYPLIELLDVSGLLNLWKSEYCHINQSVPDKTPTLLAFSSSISDLSKQSFVDYLKDKGFDIKSYTIPLAELALQKLLVDGKINSNEGKGAVLMMEATNATLHFTKLVYHDQYFLKDGDVKSIQGMGIDPRKHALCKFLVGELNSLTGLLSSEKEKEEEIERFEHMATDWLKNIDTQTGSRPVNIKNLFFKRARHIMRDILVKKSDLESDTGRYIQYLTDSYNAFKEECCPNGVNYCCFIGNCFLSERIRNQFENIVGIGRTFFYKTTEVVDIISVYPRIDLQRYADEEGRIRAKAEADAQKQQAERDAQKAKAVAKAKADEEAQRVAEENRRKTEAEKAYQRALDLDKQGNFDDAKVNIDTAVNLVPEDIKYRQFTDYLLDKIKKRNDILHLYKQYLLAGDNYCKEGKYEEALIEYEKAKSVDDNAEIRGKIIESGIQIKQVRAKKERVLSILSEAEQAIISENISLAEEKVIEVLSMEPGNTIAKKYLEDINKIKDKIELEKFLQLEEMRIQLNNAVFVEEWGKAVTIAEEYLLIQDNEDVKKKKALAQKKIATLTQTTSIPKTKDKTVKKQNNTEEHKDDFFDENSDSKPKTKHIAKDDFFGSDDKNKKQTKQKSQKKTTKDDFDF